ncbi:MAG: FtsX-like permease family protein [Tissierellia bacterium]|nr:FtsX-like permease family protein [Tissierellia bacterium]
MKKKTLFKDIVREITSSPGRFISILLMIGLGAFVYTGLASSGPKMHESLENFVRESNMEDIEVYSSFGLDEDDEKIINDVAKDAEIEYLYSKDLKVKGEDILVQLISLPKKISKPVLLEGRFPEKSGEIVMDKYLKGKTFKLGDTVNFDKEINKFEILEEDEEDKKDAFNTYTYKVVGIVNSIDFVEVEQKGYSREGLGKLSGFAYVLHEDFNMEDYSMAKIHYKDTYDYKSQAPEYKGIISERKRIVEDGFIGRPEVKLADIKDEVEDKLKEGEDEIRDARKQIDDARIKLEDADKKLKDADVELADAKVKLRDEKLKGQKKIDDADKELKDGRVKLDDAHKTLEEKKLELEDGKKKLADGKKEYEDGLVKYNDGKKKLEDGIKELEDGKKELAENEQKLIDARKEIADGEKELADGWNEYYSGEDKLRKGWAELESKTPELQAARQKIEDGKAQLAAGEAELAGQKASAESQYQSGLAELDAAEAQIDAQISQLPQGYPLPPELEQAKAGIQAKRAEAQAAYEAGLKQLEAAEGELAQKKLELEAGETELEAGEREYEAGRQKLIDSQQELVDGRNKLVSAEKELEDGKRELADGEKKLEEGKQDLADGEIEVEDAKKELADAEIELADAKKKLDDAEIEVKDGETKLNDAEKTLAEEELNYQDGVKKLEEARIDFNREVGNAEKKLADAEVELEDGKKEYQDGKDEYDTEKLDADKKIADAEEKIDDARDALLKLKLPVYVVSDRDDNMSYYLYYDSGIRIGYLAYIFPTFFYAIALLVSLTTLTRMVEERRGQVGTFKALGYGPFDIVKKYLVYSSLSSIIGGAIGAIVGERFLSWLVFYAYSSSFIFKTPVSTLRPDLVINGIMIGFITTTIATVYVVYKYLREAPATLMRTKAPKAGSRILLERLTPLWKRLGFFQKVTMRNMFRYKIRMFMTIFGVAGCLGLIFLGFALRDSISYIVPSQYEHIMKYDILSVYDKDLGELSFEDYEDYMADKSQVKDHLRILYKDLKWENEIGMDQNVSLVAPREEGRLKDFFILKDMEGSPESLEDGKVIITDKLSDLSGLGIGDEITLKDQERKRYTFKITGIANNYLGHYILMSPETYTKFSGDEPVYNGDMVKLVDSSDKGIKESEDKLNSIKCVLTAMSLSFGTIEDWLSALNIVVFVIIIISSTLAFVVLYNLNNINIQERERELSTIKVLGFYPNEMTKYIYRETIMLTLIGIIIGYLFGHFLFNIILTKIVPDILKFYEHVFYKTYIISAAITVLFSMIVMVFVHQRLKKIDMVEALKAFE